MPAYNEQGVISRTITSLLSLKYEHKEIIVIDDGSSDLTRFVAQGYEKQGVKVVYQTQRRQSIRPQLWASIR